MTAKKQPNKPILGAALAVHVCALILTWRSLSERRDDAVRGDKRIWRAASALNTLGSLAYWLLGRRPA